MTFSRWNRSSRNRPSPHSDVEILIGGGNDAHVDTNRLLPADTVELPFGKHAQ